MAMLIPRFSLTRGEPTETYPPEYYDAYSGNTLQNIAILFLVLNTLFFALRSYARFMTRGKFGWDDVFIACAYVVDIGLCTTSILIVYRGGVGRHVAEILRTNPALLTGWAKGIFAVEIIYLTAVLLPKLSVLFFYLRVFNTRTSIRMTYFTIGLITVNWVVFVVTAVFQCRPIAFWWDRTIPGGKCFNVQAFFRAMCVPNIITDLIVLALPISSILKLKLPVMKKLALLIIFFTAAIGLISSIVRFTIFFQTAAFTDETWASVSLVGWSIVESGAYLIAACLPLLRPVFAKHTPKSVRDIFSSATRSRSARSRDNRPSDSQLELGASMGVQGAQCHSSYKKVDDSKTVTSSRNPSGASGITKTVVHLIEVKSVDAGMSPGLGNRGYDAESNWHVDTDSETGIVSPPRILVT